MAELDEEGALGQGRRQAARGFHRHDRPLRRSDRLHQGALPVAAALFHRLSGGDETERRLEDRLEILPLRSARVISAQTCAPAGAASVPPLRRAKMPPVTRITTAGGSSRVGGASRLATSRKAVASFASYRAAICSLPMYQLMKRTFAGRAPSTFGCRKSLPTAMSQGVSITSAARAKKRRARSAAPASRHSRNSIASCAATVMPWP